MNSFIFGGNTGETASGLKKRRDLARRMLTSRGSIRNIGDGIGSAANSISAAILGHGADAKIAKGENEASSLFRQTLLGGGQLSPQSPSASNSDLSAPQPSTASSFQGQSGDIGSRLMTDLQSELGLSREQTAGIVGNLAHESGNFQSLQEKNPLVNGSRGGFGYAQWTGPRRRQFEAYAQQNGLDPSSYDANKSFLLHELQNTSEGAVVPQLAGAKTAGEAAEIFSNKFLRPGIPHMDSRLNYANQFAAGEGQQSPQLAPQQAQASQPQQIAQASPQQTQGINPALLQAFSNPFMNEQQRQVLGGLIQQQMKANAPLGQLDQLRAQKLQRDIETPLKRNTIKGADGFQYFTDDGKRVLPDAKRTQGADNFRVVGKRLMKIGDDGNVTDATPGGSPEKGGPFSSKSVEGQALNGLVERGILTTEQALTIGAGKTITGPQGEIIFMTPQGIVGSQNPQTGQTQPLGNQSSNGAGIQITQPKTSGFNEGQGKAAGFADRIRDTMKIIDQMEGAGTSYSERAKAMVPLFGNSLVSGKFQQLDQASRNFINATLRRESGAAIAESEFDNARKQYIPQPGDEPPVLAQKRRNREQVLSSMGRDAGPFYKPQAETKTPPKRLKYNPATGALE